MHISWRKSATLSALRLLTMIFAIIVLTVPMSQVFLDPSRVNLSVNGLRQWDFFGDCQLNLCEDTKRRDFFSILGYSIDPPRRLSNVFHILFTMTVVESSWWGRLNLTHPEYDQKPFPRERICKWNQKSFHKNDWWTKKNFTLRWIFHLRLELTF